MHSVLDKGFVSLSLLHPVHDCGFAPKNPGSILIEILSIFAARIILIQKGEIYEKGGGITHSMDMSTVVGIKETN